ncbi:alpha/beta-hydrolase [Cytidiella melzeri]|nr:alpha/beta-hydrolase [Cytidiella melzeri]
MTDAPPAAIVFPTPVSPSMETLPQTSPLRELYPEDIYPGGGYFPSPFGRTKYWIIGPEGGQKVVLVHGISVPAIIFKQIVKALVDEGLQVLTYDIPGRGYSEAPETGYDVAFYTTHLALLLQFVHWDVVDIVGYSMGGAIAAAFTAIFPHLVRENVCLIAPAGMLQFSAPQKVIFDLPAAPETNPEASAAATGFAGKLRDLQWVALPGASNAFSASVKGGIITGLEPVYNTLGMTSTKRFLIIHGTADMTVPFAHAHKIRKFVPQAKLVLVDGASHALPVEEGAWQQLVENLIPFLSGTEGRLSKYR